MKNLKKLFSKERLLLVVGFILTSVLFAFVFYYPAAQILNHFNKSVSSLHLFLGLMDVGAIVTLLFTYFKFLTSNTSINEN